MAASEQISLGLDSRDHNYMRLNSAHTLIRILCHKKDREASKFLKRQYQLPKSSGNFPLVSTYEYNIFLLVLWVIICND